MERAILGNSGTGAGYSLLELYVSTVLAHRGIRYNQQETLTTNNAKHYNRISQKRKSTTENTESTETGGWFFSVFSVLSVVFQ